LWIYKALVGLHEQEDADSDEHHPVKEGRQDLGTFVAKSLLGIRFFSGMLPG